MLEECIPSWLKGLRRKILLTAIFADFRHILNSLSGVVLLNSILNLFTRCWPWRTQLVNHVNHVTHVDHVNHVRTHCRPCKPSKNSLNGPLIADIVAGRTLVARLNYYWEINRHYKVFWGTTQHTHCLWPISVRTNFHFLSSSGSHNLEVTIEKFVTSVSHNWEVTIC